MDKKYLKFFVIILLVLVSFNVVLAEGEINLPIFVNICDASSEDVIEFTFNSGDQLYTHNPFPQETDPYGYLEFSPGQLADTIRRMENPDELNYVQNEDLYSLSIEMELEELIPVEQHQNIPDYAFKTSEESIETGEEYLSVYDEELQNKLKKVLGNEYEEDNDFFNVIKFQAKQNLKIDGIVGENTLDALDEGIERIDYDNMKKALGGDYVEGDDTGNIIRFQEKYDLVPDGIIGTKTRGELDEFSEEYVYDDPINREIDETLNDLKMDILKESSVKGGKSIVVKGDEGKEGNSYSSTEKSSSNIITSSTESVGSGAIGEACSI